MKLIIATRLPVRKAPADWKSAVGVMWAAKDIRRGICSFLAKTAARLLDRVTSLSVFAHFRGGGAGCGDGVGNGGIGRGDSTGNDGAGCGD